MKGSMKLLYSFCLSVLWLALLGAPYTCCSQEVLVTTTRQLYAALSDSDVRTILLNDSLTIQTSDWNGTLRLTRSVLLTATTERLNAHTYVLLDFNQALMMFELQAGTTMEYQGLELVNHYDAVGPTFRPVRLSIGATVLFENCVQRRLAGLPYKAALVNQVNATRPIGQVGPQLCNIIHNFTYRSTHSTTPIYLPDAISMYDYSTTVTPDSSLAYQGLFYGGYTYTTLRSYYAVDYLVSDECLAQRPGTECVTLLLQQLQQQKQLEAAGRGGEASNKRIATILPATIIPISVVLLAAVAAVLFVRHRHARQRLSSRGGADLESHLHPGGKSGQLLSAAHGHGADGGGCVFLGLEENQQLPEWSPLAADVAQEEADVDDKDDKPSCTGGGTDTALSHPIKDSAIGHTLRSAFNSAHATAAAATSMATATAGVSGGAAAATAAASRSPYGPSTPIVHGTGTGGVTSASTGAASSSGGLFRPALSQLATAAAGGGGERSKHGVNAGNGNGADANKRDMSMHNNNNNSKDNIDNNKNCNHNNACNDNDTNATVVLYRGNGGAAGVNDNGQPPAVVGGGNPNGGGAPNDGMGGGPGDGGDGGACGVCGGVPSVSERERQLAPDVLAELGRMARELRSSVQDEAIRLEAIIGCGSFGTVYKGTWRGLSVAVKTLVFSASDESRRRALQEAALCASISHPNVVATYSSELQPLGTLGAPKPPTTSESCGTQQQQQQLPDSGSGPSGQRELSKILEWRLYIIQEFADGGPLRKLYGNKALWPGPGMVQLPAIVGLALGIAKALTHLHSKRIIHGDLNPNNVLLKRDDTEPSGYVVKVGDFGLSVMLPSNRSHLSNLRMGTMFYMCPAVVMKGQVGPSSDVFSLGVMLWELYHGRRAGIRTEQGPRYSSIFPAFPPTCPEAYRAVALHCLQRQPHNRPPAATVTAHLDALLNSLRAPFALSIAECAARGVSAPTSAGAEGAGGGGGGVLAAANLQQN